MRVTSYFSVIALCVSTCIPLSVQGSVPFALCKAPGAGDSLNASPVGYGVCDAATNESYVWTTSADTLVSPALPVEKALRHRGVSFTAGNKVTLLPSGREKFQDLFHTIGQARHYVYLEYFNFRNDSIGQALFRLLERKRAEGVKVRVIYDDFGNSSNDRPLRKRHLKRIKSEQLEVQVFDPIVFPWINHAFHRDHRKIVIVDGQCVYTGGMNVADYYIHGKPEFGQWRDMHMRMEGPVVEEYLDIFCRMWERCSGVPIDSTEYLIPQQTGDTALIALQYGCYSADHVYVGVANREPRRSPAEVRKSYVESIDSARYLIQIVNPYFTLVRSVKRALYRALKRGVRVEIMLSTKCDVSVTPDVSAYNAKKLMKRGADIYYYEDGFHHSKVMMVDSSYCTIGSANLNSRSMKYDYEVNAFLLDTIPTHQLISIFEADKQHCTLLTPDNWKKRRSAGRRFMGWLYHFLSPLI